MTDAKNIYWKLIYRKSVPSSAGATFPNQDLPQTQNYTMNTSIIKGQWNIIKGRLQKSYAALTDDDLAYEEGQESELLGRLQKALGKTADEMRAIIEKHSL